MQSTLDKSQEVNYFEKLTDLVEPVVKEALKALANVLKEEGVSKETIDKAIQTYFEKLLGVDELDVNWLLSSSHIRIDKKKQIAVIVIDSKKYVIPESTLFFLAKLFDRAFWYSSTGISYSPKNSHFICNADKLTEEEISNAQSSRYYFKIDREDFSAMAIVDGQEFNMSIPCFHSLRDLYYTAKDSETGMAYLNCKGQTISLDKPKA